MLKLPCWFLEPFQEVSHEFEVELHSSRRVLEFPTELVPPLYQVRLSLCLAIMMTILKQCGPE